jgi:predicted transcriptional regulator
MRSKYRSKTEITAQILQSANRHNDATKTRIMYDAFLTYSQLKEYLILLVENGLLEHDEVRRTYKTTEKGLKFLEMYEQMEELMMTERNLPKIQNK